ncbi:TRAP transporter small permease subunit [Roseinatronobacter bogoriensis]|uniref:TRAP transporter small permease protein n=1 Tax=Roseinatronobacter bogoriensis subsp. barguzinensis TaxID=441209 RepID=A0A2K8KC57_9RHOB|nr:MULTISPECIES: TRAP transporter small permease subunit [Rhodobaca]ATX67004.1 C4-dicarboxylate ABC transporter permease [Rhodobaca barguzinensis]MBB4206505.1 TRAP-type mannitol/chloroaromatic compound transport system permease small subunit [Rhodobaca bogoriensis DSM 18756]TDW41248.1 TRAP-type mannitol/chloroaromatic compound transport system permease small subunit [Rhodobaca barguzinensis]TDY74574.1 TRAP-type mannitol/chloroaromatic compound transport system permease small subunit [Rhodobaca 
MSQTNSQFEIDLDKVEDAGARSHGLSFPRTWLSDMIETVLGSLSYVLNAIWFALVLIIVVNVTMRYALGINYVWVEEVQWHIYAVGFMFGIGYAVMHDAHVRVDVLAANFRPTLRAWIEAFSIVVIILPMCWLIISYGIPFVEASYNRGERSSAPGGLANRWMIKSVIVLAFAYIALAAFARLLRVSCFLFNFPRARVTK